MSELINSTSNQHYISQSELRWNSIDPNKPNSLIKINRFRLIDKMEFKLTSPERKRIKSISCGDDIFTLAIFDNDQRINMEKFFGYFEEQYNEKVSKFLSAIKDKVDNAGNGVVKIDGAEFYSDIKFFQKIKFLNFIRNPNNIHKSLEIFDFAKDIIVLGSGSDFQKIFESLVKNEKGHRDYICKKYEVNHNDFDSWIKLILLFVYHDENMKNSVLDGMMEEFFKASELYTVVIVGYYTEKSNKSPLIPDVGTVVDSDMTYSFNVSRNCFVTLQHTLIESEYSRNVARQVAKSMGESFTDDFFEKIKTTLSAKRHISIVIDDEKLLSGYNKICIKASAEFVYSCSTIVHGANVINN
ncbi:hypothetical protein [Pectobacterium polaris]|uniref:hypothetical protein n=1 Tax=Pectobacterium polaris TaxID=2042057 RepID=UPI001582AABF|nr:hypothetical protein [Pectobacterium polaris]